MSELQKKWVILQGVRYSGKDCNSIEDVTVYGPYTSRDSAMNMLMAFKDYSHMCIARLQVPNVEDLILEDEQHEENE